MTKKYTSVLIILVIASAIITVLAGWMKLTYKLHADDALTLSLMFYVGTGLASIIWFLFPLLKRKIYSIFLYIMKIFLCLGFLIISFKATSQKIVNAVMVGSDGITEDPKKAKFLVVVKSYTDTAFERLEYNFSGPMKRRLTYKEPLLKTLHGNFATFFPSGTISYQGNYVDNKKDGNWYIYK